MDDITTNHLINNLKSAVHENLLGLCKSNSDIQLIENSNIVLNKNFFLNKNKPNRKVAIISGGGSGHEPFPSGMVGNNGLDAAIVGEIFSSPSSLSILTAIQQFPKEIGILIIINNYTGDRLNFGLAIEHGRQLGFKIELVIISDDCAFVNINSKKNSIVDKKNFECNGRGLAGVYLTIRLANILAKKGLDLTELKNRLNYYVKLLTTFSISLTSCDIPGIGKSFNLEDLQIELGLGIHGELGVSRTKLGPIKKIIENMLNQLLTCLILKLNDKFLIEKSIKNNLHLILLINNLGGLSQFELNLICNELIYQLHNQNKLINNEYIQFKIVYLLKGIYLSSFAMHGFSITILPYINDNNYNLLELLNASQCPCIQTSFNVNNEPIVKSNVNIKEELIKKINIDDLSSIEPCLTKLVFNACNELINAKKELNELDSELGDSDCGTTIANLSNNILKKFTQDIKYKISFHELANCTAASAGGTSGAIYSLLFNSLSLEINKLQFNLNELNQQLNLKDFNLWGNLLIKISNITMKYSSTSIGNRTMFDLLVPFANKLIEIKNPVNKIDYLNTLTGLKNELNYLTQSTKHLIAKSGRASYAAKRKSDSIDPGVKGVYYLLYSILNTLYTEANL